MKVLHIGKYYFPFFGGIEKVNQDLVENHVYRETVTPFVLAHHDIIGVASEFSTINQVQVLKVKLNGVVAYAPIASSFLQQLNKVIDDFQPDLIHIHMPNLSAFACLFSKKARKIPWVVHWHSDVIGAVPDLKIKLLYPFYRVLEKRLLTIARKILVTSPPYLAHSAGLNAFKGKCCVIPIGIRNSTIAPSCAQTINQLNLLMIGRLTYYKGHSLLLKAIAKLSVEVSVNLSVIGDGELKQELIELSAALGLQSRVNFLGRVSDSEIATQLANTDLLCLPSIEKTEAFGVVLLEAAMHSKPALVTDVEGSGMSWVVQDGLTGYVVKNNSVDALYEKLIEIYNNKANLLTLGVNAKRRFDEVFNLDQVAAQTTQVYKQIITDKAMLDNEYHLD